MYIVERKLGKGGFGQVYVGRRAVASTAKDGPNANYVRPAFPPQPPLRELHAASADAESDLGHPCERR